MSHDPFDKTPPLSLTGFLGSSRKHRTDEVPLRGGCGQRGYVVGCQGSPGSVSEMVTQIVVLYEVTRSSRSP